MAKIHQVDNADCFVGISPGNNSGFFNKIESSDFKSCKASFLLSNDYLHDQGSAAELMDKLQVFVEKYPKSKFIEEVDFFF